MEAYPRGGIGRLYQAYRFIECSKSILSHLCIIPFRLGADLSSNPTETTFPRVADLTTKLASPTSLVQIGNSLFVVTRLRIVLGIITILVVIFVIAIRKRWIEILFESASEGELLPSEETGGEADGRPSIPGETPAANRWHPYERQTGLVEAELPRITGQIVRVRVALEAERSKLQRVLVILQLKIRL